METALVGLQPQPLLSTLGRQERLGSLRKAAAAMKLHGVCSWISLVVRILTTTTIHVGAC